MQPQSYLSICSGIEAATTAWHDLGWTPVGFAEIDAAASMVLAHHYGSNLRGGLAADGPRYKQLGNSMAVSVMRWLGERLAQFQPDH